MGILLHADKRFVKCENKILQLLPAWTKWSEKATVEYVHSFQQLLKLAENVEKLNTIGKEKKRNQILRT